MCEKEKAKEIRRMTRRREIISKVAEKTGIRLLDVEKVFQGGPG